MARGGHSPVEATPTIPQVSFTKVEENMAIPATAMSEQQARIYGYNDGSDFPRPHQYIRHIEPLEMDLERQVEYDMDEQDQEWLDAVNLERKKEQLDKISYEIFEIVMDRLEKEWFNLTKHIPKTDLALPSEDSTCAICDDSEGENSNAIVFCDGCNLAVHQDCYGVPYIPEGQWLCRKCTVSPENPVSCDLCPNEGGAFKQSDQGDWIHLLCAIWIPETRVSNDVFMEPIIGVEKISKGRWKLKCTICGTREGACIQCAKQSCFTAFHVTCARKDKLLLPMKSQHGSEPTTLAAYCDRHLPKEQAEIREAALKAEEEQEDDEYSAKLSKSARAYAKTYKPGPPLVPAIIVDRILQYISRTTIRKKPDFVALLCKYWSLKREARRGAPLLKRLHLEPWTASSGAKNQGEEEKLMKLEQLQHLRRDLEDLKALTSLSLKRENRKLEQANLIRDIISHALFLHTPKLREAFDKIVAKDQNDHFKTPVSKRDVPDYFDIVKNPMCWDIIEAKLDNRKYWDIQEFKDDIQLVLDNAILYNKATTPHHRTATRLQKSVPLILAELDKLPSSPNLRSTESTEDTAAASWMPQPIGDLEPPLELLELFLSKDAVEDESELILSADPITSLFSMELEKRKPTPPPPPTPPADPKIEKRRLAREADRQKRLHEKQKRLDEKQRAKERRALEKQRREEQRHADGKIHEERLAERRIVDGQRRAAQREARRLAEAEAASTTGSLSSTPDIGSAPRTRGARAALAAALEAESGNSGSSVSAPSRPPRTARASTSASAPVPVPPEARRASVPIPAPGDIPLVDRVDQRGSFMLFDQGWILPAGSRRGGRAPVERTTAPPPKKKMRLDSGSSRLSVFSTAASENRTLTPDIGPAPTTHDGADNSMDVDSGERAPYSKRSSGSGLKRPASSRLHSLSGVNPEGVVIPPPNVIHTPDGKVIIEELDTPAIRREKRRLEKEKLMADAGAGNAASLALFDDTMPPSPMTSTSSEDDDHRDGDASDSELSALSDDDSDRERETAWEKPREGEELNGESELDALEAEQELGIGDDPGTMDVPEARVVGPEENLHPEENVHIDSPGAEVDVSQEHQGQDAVDKDHPMEEVDAPEEAPAEPSEALDVVAEEPPHAVTDSSIVQNSGKTDMDGDSAAPEDAPEDSRQEPEGFMGAAETETDPSVTHQVTVDADRDSDVSAPASGEANVDASIGAEADGEADGDADASGEADVEPGADGSAEGDGSEHQMDVDEDDKQQDKVVAAQTKSKSKSNAPQRRQAARSSRNRDLGRLKPPGGGKLEPSTLVWAKSAPFPWWPAVIVHDDDVSIPTKVLKETQAERKKVKDWLYIVRFYDRNKSWQYLPLDKMRALGEIKELDQDMLSNNSTMQPKSWRKNTRKECQKAYEEALDAMESDDQKEKFLQL